MQLKFAYPVFIDGNNVSVRKGEKWASEAGTTVEVATVSGERVGDARITECIVKRFCDLEDADIAAEHDPKLRTPSALFPVMREVYPGFSESDIVTLVHFTMQ